MSDHMKLTSYTAAFVKEIVASGIQDVVISPGSRSTPLAMVMAEHPDLSIYMHVDERSAAFFALGIAKAKQKPVALLCTSGTAAANYYPAIIEAKYARVPLLVLTADRPHELREVGAPQAIDQVHLFGNKVKWFVDMSPPENSTEMIRYVRTTGARAVVTAISEPAGPVHLNFPFREPLVPAVEQADIFQMDERQNIFVQALQCNMTLPSDQVEKVIDMLQSAKRGMIVCGSICDSEFPNEVIALATELQFPILADPLSGVRSVDDPIIIDTYNTFLKNEQAQEWLKPDLIIRFGAMPISKSLMTFIGECNEAKHIVVDGGQEWRDPTALATHMIHADEVAFCKSIRAVLTKDYTRSAYVRKWIEINDVTTHSLRAVDDITTLSEGKLFHTLLKWVPENATLFVGNSMPIRDLDTFFHKSNKRVRIMANRGVNGIDGIISTALGAATTAKPMYVIVGDLTFFHDLNGLIAAKMYNIPLTIIVINNNGGGIFSFLPQAKKAKHFEKLFATPLHIDFSHAVHMYGGRYELISDWDHLDEALSTQSNNNLNVFEVQTNRTENEKEHRDLWNNVSQEINYFLKGEI